MVTDGQSSYNIARAQALGHTVTTRTMSSTIATPVAQLLGFDAIFLSPGAPSATFDLLRFGVTDGGRLQQYAYYGGTLVLNVSCSQGQGLIAPGGVNFCCTSPGHNAEQLTTPDHPYLTGAGYGGQVLSASRFLNWNQTDHGYLSDVPGGGAVILSNSDGPALVAYPVGGGAMQGRVLVSTLNYGWATGGDARGAPLDNLLDYALVPEPVTLLLLLGGSGMVLRRRRAA